MRGSILIILLLSLASCQSSQVSQGPVVSLPGTSPEPTPPVVSETPAPAPKPVLPELGAGDNGPYVSLAQTILKKLGYAVGTVDGIYGPATKASISKFQKDKGLAVSGQINAQTWMALNPPVDISFVLPWDNGARNDWTKLTLGLIGGELWSKFSIIQDGPRLCPKWVGLSKDEQVLVLATAVAWTAYYESAWDPKMRFFETSLGYYSEGLLQLSYQDKAWTPGCGFDKNDSAKSILDPLLNLDCGLRIMANQISKDKKLILSRGVYWSTLQDGGRYSKVSDILAKTNALPICK